MAKEKISVTVDAAVLAAADADAKAAGLNRSEIIEQALRNEHLRVTTYRTTRTEPSRRWTSTPTRARCTKNEHGPLACDHSRRHRPAPQTPAGTSCTSPCCPTRSPASAAAVTGTRHHIPSFIPGRLPDDVMAMVVAVEQPEGTLLPELVQWLPSAALDEPIGTIGADALRETTALVTALIT